MALLGLGPTTYGDSRLLGANVEPSKQYIAGEEGH
jgi:hypothetical protein